MAGTRGIRAGAAFVELFTEDKKLVRGLRSAQRRLKAFSASVRQAGMALLATSALFAAPLVAGTRVFADFEQQMANVSTMLQDPSVHMERFRSEIRRMSVEFGESTEALAGGLYDILSASVPAEHALNVLTVAVRAAKAGMTDTATSADAITTVLNAYGLAADQAGQVSDLLFSIVMRGKLTFEQLAPKIGNVATIAASAGLSLDELGAMLALLTRNGIKTEQAITAVVAILSTFLKPSAEAAALAKEFGIEMDAAALRSEGLMGIMQKIQSLPPDLLARLFPNVEALKGVLPALRDLEGFGKDIEAMRNRAGATETAYAKMTATLTHAFAQLRQAGVLLLSVIGEELAADAKRVVTVLKRLLLTTAGWVKANGDVVRTVAKVVVVVAAVGAVLVGVAGILSLIGLAFGGLAAIVSGTISFLSAVGSVIGAILTPAGLITVAVLAIGAAIIWATGAGGVALDWLAGQFAILKSDAIAAWQGIKDALVAGDIALAARILWTTLQMEWKRGVHLLNQAWVGFKEFFLSTATDAFFGLAVILADAWSNLELAWVELVAFLADAWTGFTVDMLRTWNQIQGKLQKGFLELMGLLDGDLNVEAAKQLVDQEVRETDSRIVDDTAATMRQREQQREDRKAEIEKEREGTLIAISEMADETDRQRREQFAEDLAETEAELAQARADWQAAIDEARQKREAVESGDAEGDSLSDLIAKLKDQLGGQPANLSDRVDVIGTFNAELINLLGGGTAAERTAKATEDTAKNTQKLLDEVRDNGLAFE